MKIFWILDFFPLMIPDKVKWSTVWTNNGRSDLDEDEQFEKLQFQEFLILVNFECFEFKIW